MSAGDGDGFELSCQFPYCLCVACDFEFSPFGFFEFRIGFGCCRSINNRFGFSRQIKRAVAADDNPGAEPCKLARNLRGRQIRAGHKRLFCEIISCQGRNSYPADADNAKKSPKSPTLRANSEIEAYRIGPLMIILRLGKKG